MFARFPPARVTRPVTASISPEVKSVLRYRQDLARHRGLAPERHFRLQQARLTSMKGAGPPAAFGNQTYGHFPPDTYGRLEMTIVGPDRLLPNQRKRGRSPV